MVIYADNVLMLVAALGLSLLLGLWQSRCLRRQILRQQKVIVALQQDLDALCCGAREVGVQLSRTDLKLKRLFERQDQLELRDPESREIDQAVKMIRNGADVEQLVSECGLPRGEAELLSLIHRPRSKGVPPRDSAIDRVA